MGVQEWVSDDFEVGHRSRQWVRGWGTGVMLEVLKQAGMWLLVERLFSHQRVDKS